MSNLMLPGNPRYQPKQLQGVFGYDNLFRKVADVEIAAMLTLSEIGVIPEEDIKGLTDEVIERLRSITTSEVDEVERKITHHDIRAWVRLAQEILPERLRRWVHVPLTSYDALDTARSLQFSEAYNRCIRPELYKVLDIFSSMTEEYADTIQIGRTHLKHALPITVGFWMASTLSRFLYNTKAIERASDDLVGKISGAVGAYNAQVGLGMANLPTGETFEERVLARLHLAPGDISTQILPPEPVAYLLHACCMLSASFGQFGRDCRQLMRDEVAEVQEEFEEGQVGSSTMAHKRNPINFENLEGTWLKNKNELGKVMDTLISDHQRDLVGSSVARDFPVIMVNLMLQINTLLRPNKQGVTFLQRIKIHSTNCRRNFDQSAHLVLAEPLYIALQMAGYEGDAHEVVNHKATPRAQVTGEPLIDALQKVAELERNETILAALANIPPQIVELLQNPENYTGWASAKARQIAKQADEFINRTKEEY